MLLLLARVWAYPLWWGVIHSESADAALEDVDWWMRCINQDELLRLDRYSQFAYLSGALPEFRTLLHYRLRTAPLVFRLLLRLIYRPAATLTLDAERNWARTVHPAWRGHDRHRADDRKSLLDQPASHHRPYRPRQADAG